MERRTFMKALVAATVTPVALAPVFGVAQSEAAVDAGVGIIESNSEFVTLKFGTAYTIKHGSGLIIPGGQDIKAGPSDILTFYRNDADTFILASIYHN